MISKTGVHAITALAVLARLPEGRCAGAAAVARQIGSPPNYLGKLLQKLGNHGLVLSVKGQGGGFRLARSPESIRLIDVVDPLEQLSRWTACFLGRPTCSDATPCPVHERWTRARAGYLDLLTVTTIADLLTTQGGEADVRHSGPARRAPRDRTGAGLPRQAGRKRGARTAPRRRRRA